MKMDKGGVRQQFVVSRILHSTEYWIIPDILLYFKRFRVWPLPSKIIWDRKIAYLTTIDIVSYRLWDIWLQTFCGLTLTLDPQRSLEPRGKQSRTIRKLIHDFLFDFYRHYYVSILYFFREDAGQNFEGRIKWQNLTFSWSLSDIFIPSKGSNTCQTALIGISRIKIGPVIWRELRQKFNGWILIC